METEIELKFFVSPKFSQSLLHKISTMKVLQQGCRQLSNVYFDTNDLRFRHHDMGLRIRGFDGVFVQTLKTAGRVVAGLHQRPEYNAETTHTTPLLSLHPEDAWPEGFDIAKAESELTALFSTDFERQQWLIALNDGSQIEVAFDQGWVRAEDRESPICEVELELISGQPEALFSLARDLCSDGGMRLGNLSKAARGYRLAFQSPTEAIKALSVVKLTHTDSVEDAFIQTLEHALSHWHRHEQIYIEQPSLKALQEMQQALILLRQALVIFGKLIPRRASSLLRQELQWLDGEFAWLAEAHYLDVLLADKGQTLKKLTVQKPLMKTLQKREENLPATKDMLRLLSSARYCGLWLDLSRWILNRGWQPFLDEKARKKVNANVHGFAKQALTRSWEELEVVFVPSKTFTRSDYLDQYPRLQRNLYSGLCFAHLFDEESRTAFRLPWLDLLQGMEDLQQLDYLRHLMGQFDGDDREQMEKWLHRREESLLHAMNQTRQQGMKFTPYW